MSTQELERLVRKYYGYVADLEGSGVEALDLLFVRDKIQRFLDGSTPETAIPHTLYDRIFELDRWLWEEQESFLTVVGVAELQYARQQQGSRRSHWWWYLDELAAPPQPFAERQERLAQALAG